MAISDFFKPVKAMAADEVRDFIARHHPDDFQLLDVRQPREYEAGHLPGAIPVSIGEIEKGAGNLDPQKQTIVYCSSGVRSRAAASVLSNAGFTECFCMSGGLQAWNGNVATGFPETDLACFRAAGTAEEAVALAWLLEKGAEMFYSGLAGMIRDRESASLFRELAAAEVHHEATLRAVYEGLAGKPAGSGFPRGVLSEPPQEGIMEGGLVVEQALALARSMSVHEMVELAISVETNAYDRYLILHREVSDENAKRAFEVIASEERRHLKNLTEMLEHFL